MIQRIFASKTAVLGTAGLVFLTGFQMETAEGQELAGCRDPRLKPSRFRLWVRPDYPEAARAAGQTGVVEVQVDVGEGGKASALKIGTEPNNDVFESAVQEVAENWRYIVPITKTCEPQTSRVHARIHFRLDEGKPVVSLEEISPADAGKGCEDPIRVVNQKEVRDKLVQLFPRVARRSGSEGVVYVAITVSVATGETRDVEVVHLVDGGSAKREFRNAATLGFRELRVEPRAGATADETVRICRSVRFELKK